MRRLLTTIGILFTGFLILTGYPAVPLSSATLTTLYNFTGSSDGASPIAGVVVGATGDSMAPPLAAELRTLARCSH